MLHKERIMEGGRLSPFAGHSSNNNGGAKIAGRGNE